MINKLFTPQLFQKKKSLSSLSTTLIFNNNSSRINYNRFIIFNNNNNNNKYINNINYKYFTTLSNNNNNSDNNKTSPTTSTTSPSTSTSTSTSTSSNSTITNLNNNQSNKENIEIINNMNNNNNKTLIDKYLKNTYEYPRFSSKWWLEKSYIFGIFGITGTSSLYVVKFLLKYIFGYPNPSSLVSIISGSAPMDVKYSIIYFLTMYTVYPFILLTFGTLFGRYQFFVKFFNRMSVFSQIKRIYLRLNNKNKNK